jgi:hypothetical protein
MNPITHLLTSWTVANLPRLESRDRAIVTIAGISPDIDAAGIVVELATKHTDKPLFWWSEYHHVLGHNLIFGLTVFLVAAGVAKRRLLTACLAFFVFQLHLFCDLIGARGPEGYQWPILYFYPYFQNLEIVWSGQWALNAWPNIVLTIFLITITVYLAWKRGFSPLEIISKRIDRAVVQTFRIRFGTPKQPYSSV